MQSLPRLGVGLNFQRPLLPLLTPDLVDYVEIVPDMFWLDHGPDRGHDRYEEDRSLRPELDGLAARLPLVLHSIGLSIGSAHRFDRAHVARIATWQQRYATPWHSDHLSFHLAQVEGVEVNVGVQLPLHPDAEVAKLVAPRVRAVRDAVAAPFLLEHNVNYVVVEGQEHEARWLGDLCRGAGCGIVLDLHNLYANAVNHRFDPFDWLARLDLELVGEIHVAGGHEWDGFWLDAHAGVLPDAVWDLLAWVLPRTPNVGGVTFEVFGSWVGEVGLDRLAAELERLRAVWDRGATQGVAATGVEVGA